MIVLLTAGIMRVFDGIWLIHNSNAPLYSLTGALLGTSFKTYGWIYLAVGVVLILSGLALASGSEIARWIGVFAGSVLAITAIWWVPYSPVWALLYVAIGIGLIYALVAYGGDPAADEAGDTATV
jgi:hypothetical protein